MKINLSKRLKEIVNLCDNSKKIIDIGTDHALVPISLILNNKCNHVIASDLREGPLEFAKKNIKKFNLETKISIKMSDGLENFTDDDLLDVNQIIISGMGGENIISIIEKKIHKIKENTVFILQPQTNIELLRTWLLNNNIQIIAEKFLSENNKFYQIIKARKVDFKMNDLDDLEMIVGISPIIDIEYIYFLERKIESLIKMRESLEKSQKLLLDDISIINSKIFKLNEYLKKVKDDYESS